MDTNIWNVYANSNLAEYAIGGPTIELFCASYKDTHPSKYIECEAMSSANGYKVKWSDSGDENYTTQLSGIVRGEFKGIYIIGDNSGDDIWLASPSAAGVDSIMHTYSNIIMYGNYKVFSNPGWASLRPIVCLRAGTQLKKKINESTKEVVYEIVNQK